MGGFLFFSTFLASSKSRIDLAVTPASPRKSLFMQQAL